MCYKGEGIIGGHEYTVRINGHCPFLVVSPFMQGDGLCPMNAPLL